MFDLSVLAESGDIHFNREYGRYLHLARALPIEQVAEICVLSSIRLFEPVLDFTEKL
jgi:hypothetical protein